MPSILGANSVTGDFITNSLRLSPSDNGFLERTTAGVADSNRRTFTFSWWTKISVGVEQHLYGFRVNANNASFFRFNANGQLRFANEDNDGTVHRVETNRKFRDTSAFYHIVLRVDTTQGTAANRVRIYVNGVEETSLATTDYPALNYQLEINQTDSFIIGSMRNTNGTTTGAIEGYLADVHFADGQSLAPTVFGETNDNGVWIPKNCKADITYGTRGFFLNFSEGNIGNSGEMAVGNIGADYSGKGNHFASGNVTTLDQTTDTPTNNFATMNPLDNFYSAHTMSEGNVKFVTNGSGDGPFQTATIGDLKQGKWYFEFKYTDPAHTGGGDAAGEFYGQIGICGSGLSVATDAAFSSFEHNFAYSSDNGRIKFNNTAGTVHGASISADGQIIGFLIDLDNNRVTTHLNGQYADGSGNHDESSPTAYVSVTAPASTPLGGYMIAFGENVGSSESGNQNTGTYEINFGNPSFAISSSNADADGHGNFEYAVPSGYFALCTKNLAEYG